MVTVGALPKAPVTVTNLLVSAACVEEDEDEDEEQPARATMASKGMKASAAARRMREPLGSGWVTEESPRSDTALYVFGRAYSGYRVDGRPVGMRPSHQQTLSLAGPPDPSRCPR